MPRCIRLIGLVLLVALPSLAQTQEEAQQAIELGSTFISPKAGPSCTGGVALDDSTFENGYRIPFAFDARYVQRLVPSSYPSTLSRVCVCWSTGLDGAAMPFNFVIYSDQGPGGLPGALLGTVPSVVGIGTPLTQSFVGADCANLNLRVNSGGFYLGVQWNSATNFRFFICSDESVTTAPSVMYLSSTGGSSWTHVGADAPDARALGIRGEFASAKDPDPPAGPWLTTSGLPGYQFKAQIGGNRAATQVADCVPETLCLAGAIPTRSEIFVRIIGPRSNGFLWPEIVRFTVAQTELWVQQLSSGEINYYKLAAVSADSDVLNGLVDREGFLP